ncbi:unnamed protein product [Triticum turgidum subsp. durum]|uniref:serine--tRNA ligase n=1 Tax=Triticum turgidum subsp. durum TaxID=4567 RepID=A0A9R0YV79_TRITD|nr:unnamed protein product [Triticum turgidum subsp. durum]
MLDINLFRKEKGGDPELVRQSQRSRFAPVELVDEVIVLDEAWRQRQFELDKIRQELNKTSKEIGKLKARLEEKLKNHVDLCIMLDIVSLDKGADVAGGRGFFLKGDGVLLNQALINFGLSFLGKREFTPMQTPFFMRKEIMAKCAQLAQFDEELYKVTGDGEDKYLIATSEQPLCAYHLGDRIYPADLPIRYAGFSTCFRKEAGSHGRDTAGIFRVHQFEKIEQFCATGPNDSVSCSNCTDYQARRLGIGYGQKKNDEQSKQFVHMLNSTLTATERTLCCILENYQREGGVEVPEVLRPFMLGIDFLPFKRPLVDSKQAAADSKPNKSKPKGNAG